MAAPRRGWYGKEYERHRGELISNDQLAFMGDYRGGVAMLKARRVDLVMGDLYALEAAARQVEMVLSKPLMTLINLPKSCVKRKTGWWISGQYCRNGTRSRLNFPYQWKHLLMKRSGFL